MAGKRANMVVAGKEGRRRRPTSGEGAMAFALSDLATQPLRTRASRGNGTLQAEQPPPEGGDSILDHVSAGIFGCDATGRITFFNRRAAELWGREPRLDGK